MKNILVTFALLFCVGSFASSEISDREAIDSCLAHWKTHPFAKDNPTYTTLATTTKVLGIGSSIQDDKKTDAPALILVKPGTAVLTKNVHRFGNPNGLYCLKAQTTVLGKTELELHCSAHLASGLDDATVLGANEGPGGTTVLGSLRVNRFDCPKPQ